MYDFKRTCEDYSDYNQEIKNHAIALSGAYYFGQKQFIGKESNIRD